MTDRAALVDVDGTLVDSNYHHAIAWSRALHEHGHPVPLFRIHRLIGMGGSEMLESLIGHADETIEKAWRGYFDALLPEIRAFADAGALLDGLHARGFAVVLATSSPADLLDALREKIGADHAIDAVVTASDVEDAKPAPDVFAVALEHAGVDAEHAIALGDTVWDVKAAHRTALQCITLESGGISRAELLEAGARAVYADASELLRNLDESPFATF
jgi:HAD superfamily hydrolase (TIGR01509 family)